MTHPIRSGIVCNGVIVGGVDFVLRDKDAWWNDGDLGTSDRRGKTVNLLGGHWTAGQPHVGPSAGPRVVRNMKARKSLLRPGELADVGIHFVISWDGLVWQTCDLAVATSHIGARPLNRRSIGVETCWPGTHEQARKLGVDGIVIQRKYLGSKRSLLQPSDALLESWVRLANALATLPAECGIAIPRAAAVRTERFTPKEQQLHRGAMEHWHRAGTTKTDAGGLLCGALVADGWRAA